MKLPLTILLIAFLILSVSAADLTPIGNRGTPVFKDPETPLSKTIRYEPVEMFSPDLVTAVRQFVGFEPKDSQVVVYFGEEVLAIIPPESRFNGITIHDFCVRNFQYGTNDWQICENRKAKEDKRGEA